MRRMPVLARFTPLAILIVASGCGAVASDRAADVAPSVAVHATDHCVCGTPEGDLLGCTAHDCPNRISAQEGGK